jgi:hypothetical protein
MIRREHQAHRTEAENQHLHLINQIDAKLGPNSIIGNVNKELSQIDVGEALAQFKAILPGELKRYLEPLVNHIDAQRHQLEARVEIRNPIQKGLSFEASVLEKLRVMLPEDSITDCSNTPGFVDNSKKGDCLWKLNMDKIAGGQTVAIEAKSENGYTPEKALTELRQVCINRGTEIGVLILDARIAPDEFEFKRHGNHILVTWNPDDESLDVALHAALTLAGFMLTELAQTTDETEVDFDVIRKAFANIESTVRSCEKLSKLNKTISNNSGKIAKELLTIKMTIEKSLVKVSAQLANTKPIGATADN